VLALRADLTGEPTFRELLGRTRKKVLEAFAHSEMPFEKIIWDLHRTRDESRTPIFQVLFQTTTVDFRVTGLQGVEVTPTFFDPHTSEYDISVDVRDGANGMSCAFRYATDLFERETMERMAKQYEMLLREIVAKPEARISDLEILRPEERKPVVESWNETEAEFPRTKCIHELVEQRATESPEATAAVWKGAALTYRELDQRANQLAHYLQGQGIGPDDRVAICIERSLEMLVAVLGVLKAGGAYLPLEPNTPTERLRLILRGADVKVVLTSSQVEAILPETDAPRVRLDRDRGLIAGQAKVNPSSPAQPSDLAYVIYTSGTTGEPKGVMVEHHSLVNHATFFARYYALTTEDRVLQFAPLAFDFAAEEIFPAWLSGAAVVIRPEHEALAPREFFEFVRENGVTVLDLPTAFWHTLVRAMDEFDLALPPSIRLVIVGGEKASARALLRWRERVGAEVRWVNTYGPTEATIAVTTYEPDILPSANSELPIGRPIANAKLFILDDRMQPVPIGLPGELYIGGEPVARGYVDDGGRFGKERLATEDDSVLRTLGRRTDDSSPFRFWEGMRLYRTGDAARWRGDGNIEFRGRADRQIKLRGFRIELGEIEAALAKHARVRDCVVVLREDERGEKRLVAYVVARGDGGGVTQGELRAWLAARLPEYMVPTAYVSLDALPLGANGKMNMRALPMSDEFGLDSLEEYTEPQTHMEKTAAEIWMAVLGVPQVGRNDDFFQLGGHSLLATLAVARAEAAFGQTIPLRTLFEHPKLQDWVRELQKSGETSSAPPIVRVAREKYQQQVNATAATS
jgi:amino acid adenylation domain-containing protein